VVDLEAQNVGQLLNPRQDLLELPLVPSDNGHVINIDVELSLWEFAAEGAVESFVQEHEQGGRHGAAFFDSSPEFVPDGAIWRITEVPATLINVLDDPEQCVWSPYCLECLQE
jgi:hypothetical protein